MSRLATRSGLAKLVFSSVFLAATGVGCSLIVSGDVPDFKCASAAPSACPGGMICNLDTGQCISGEGGAVDPVEAGEGDAPVDDVRDGATDADADASGPLALGSKCRVDSECKSRLCGSSTILTTTITQSTGPICTTPCCNSGECAPSFVCFNGGTGGGYCVPAPLAQRQPATAGGRQPGATCSANAECRSGLCTGTPRRCLDTCCTQGECAAGATCRLQEVAAPGPSHVIWVCAAAESGATKQPGDQCADSTECASDNCVGIGTGRICRPPCSNTASCKSVFPNGHCLYGSSGSDFFKFCFSLTVNSRSAAGVTCNDDSTCQSDYCDGDLKKCANVCAKDTDCAASEACRPSAANTPYLRCVPRP